RDVEQKRELAEAGLERGAAHGEVPYLGLHGRELLVLVLHVEDEDQHQPGETDEGWPAVREVDFERSALAGPGDQHQRRAHRGERKSTGAGHVGVSVAPPSHNKMLRCRSTPAKTWFKAVVHEGGRSLAALP